MAIKEGYRANFDTILRAARNNDLALIEAKRDSDGKEVVLLCAVASDEEEYNITPFAEMCSGNPFEDYIPFPERSMD